MLGLVNRALRSFLRDTHGESFWQDTAADSGVSGRTFEALLPYDDAISFRMLETAAQRLQRSEQSILEDFGQWLVTSQTGLPLRRLLRFGGTGFTDFLYSLEELPDRARLALPVVRLPPVRLTEEGDGTFRLQCGKPAAFAPILVGVVQAMADDYGALVLVDIEHMGTDGSVIALRLHAANFAAGTRFDLAGDPL